MSKKPKAKKTNKPKPVTSTPAKNAAEYVARGKYRKLAIAEKPAVPQTPMDAGLAAVAAMKPASSAPAKETKLTKVIELLSRPDGATIDQLVDATGWQKHTVRAALSHALGKKRGYKIVSDKEKGGKRTYKIAEPKQ